MIRATIGSTLLSLFIVACAAESDELSGGSKNVNGASGDDGTPGTDDPANPGDTDPGAGGDPTQPGSCKVGVPHVGFAGTDFVADRKPGGIGADRRRVKPFSALKTEFQRTLGAVPPAMNQSSATYGDNPARWYSEPTAGAVSLITTYSLAFTGCYETMTQPEYATQPTATSAEAGCAKLERKFWQRTGTPEEIKSCVDFTMGLTTEPVARRKWAHACASVMTSTGFTTY